MNQERRVVVTGLGVVTPFGMGAEPLWAKRPSFQDAYDYDSDGRPDYITKRGFVKFTVHRRNALEIQYIQSDAENPSQNASTIFRAFIDPAGKRLERLP